MSAPVLAQENKKTVWLTFDEVVDRQRFRSRRALYAHLRRHPAPVYQRVGSRRYFMKEEDVDLMMAPVDLRTPAARRDGGEAAPVDLSTSTFVPVDINAPKRGRGRPKGSKNRPITRR